MQNNAKRIPNEEKVLAEAKVLLENGATYGQIEKTIEAPVSREWYRRRLDPSHAARIKERNHRHRTKIKTMKEGRKNPVPQKVPDDTRNLTARYFNDPLPGRSALDKLSEEDRQKLT